MIKSKNILITFLTLALVSALYSQDTAEYNGLKMYFPGNNQKIFHEGEQILFYSVCENTTSMVRNEFMLVYEFLIDKTTNDTIKKSFESSHGNYTFRNSTLPVTYHYQPKEKFVYDSRILLTYYGDHYYPYLNKYLPPRMYYFKPGKYRALYKIDIQPTGQTKAVTFDFEVIPFSGNEKKEFEDLVNSIEWSLSEKEYKKEDPKSFHSYVLNKSNTLYKDQAYFYFIHNFFWMRRHFNDDIDNDALREKYDLLNEIIAKVSNPVIRYQYAQHLGRQVMFLKKRGIINDEILYLDKVLISLKKDDVSSSTLIFESKARGASNLKNYALSTE